MTVQRDDFAAFFAALHDGHAPYRWQQRLLAEVLKDGRWPDRIAAPTGSGKTAVIDVHVFALALAAAGRAPFPPRRLALVVGRRVLVDDQYRYAQHLAKLLALPVEGEPPVVAAVRELLWTLRSPDPARSTEERSSGEVSPLVFGRLRGGLPSARDWRDHPTAAAVLCATPDMWGSRLLFRGYGSSGRAWPREAGLLAVDSVVVVDEAHLARQLLCTARRVAALVPVADRGVGAAPLQVVETTATPAGAAAGTSIGVDEDDLDDEVLARRLTRPKPLALLPVAGWEATRPSTKVTALIADTVLAQLGAPAVPGTSGTVGCFVNTVGRAVAVAQELRKRIRDGHPLRVVMICGQVRPIDVDRLEIEHPGLLTPAGNPRIDVLVSTQSLEVGVDLDLAAMVMELASGSAIAQRAGRVNRQGLRETGPVTVVLPEPTAFTDKLRSGPYEHDELAAAAEWLAGLEDVAPWALRAASPPAAERRRTLFQRPELAQAWHWARTSDELAAEPELDLWLAEDFTSDTSVDLVVRDALPPDVAEARDLIRALPPRRHELFSVPWHTARAVLVELGEDVPALVVRGDDVGPLEWSGERRDRRPRLRPGDVVVLDSAVELFTRSDTHFSPPVVVPVDREAPPPERYPADDVLEAQAVLPTVWEDRQVGGVVHRMEIAPSVPFVDALIGVDEPPTPAEQRVLVESFLAGRASTPMARAAARLLAEHPTRAEVIVLRGGEENLPARVAIVDRRRAAADEQLRQVWVPDGRQVLLDDHQRAVAERAVVLGRALGLDGDVVDLLRLAGAHHDDGKADPRFQRKLGARDGAVLAKSRAGTSAEQNRRNARASGLPGNWRHEQLSVLACWDATASSVDHGLVARLVGTSHGYGRSGFPHAATGLVAPNPTAEWLFDLGGWDDLVEDTTERYGVWVCAFLEAVLRAADGQISEEGR